MTCTSENGIQMRKEIDKVKFTQVRHMPGSSKYTPKNYSSWKEFWKAKSTSIEPFPENGEYKCDCCGKQKEIFCGGHVISIEDEKNYIYPICEECNNKAKENNEFSRKYFRAKRGWLVILSSEDAVSNDENQKE